MNPTPASDQPAPPLRTQWLVCALLALILACGIFLRIHPWAGFREEFDPAHGKKRIGFDEALYMKYVGMLHARGIGNYPEFCEAYIEAQREMPSAILPPTRFLYIFCSYLWYEATGWSTLHSLHAVSSLFTILTLLISAAFARRLGGNAAMLGVTALMAVAPTQIHMGQHALIDGVFAFWALLSLWLLWENLQSPDNPLWLSLYAASIALMVVTKENAAFVFVALCGVMAVSWWLKSGRVTLKLLLVSAAGPLLGLAVLVNLAGGPRNFIEIYRLLVQKAYALEYAIKFCDGPWYRYLVDLLLVSPLVLLLAIGAFFSITREKKPQLYLAAFLVLSYLFMANVKYSMNLRYANMWDMPLRFLAFSQLSVMCVQAGLRKPLWIILGGFYAILFVGVFKMGVENAQWFASPTLNGLLYVLVLASIVCLVWICFRRRGNALLAFCVLAICAVELRQYLIMFVQFPMYELVTEGLLRAVRILK